MSKKKTTRFCLGRPVVIDASTLALGIYSTDAGRLGQVVISVNVIAVYAGAVEVAPELIEKLKTLLSPERNTSFKLESSD
ncbi:hypothetical protein BTJ39_06845 [Izhakiella australiensis]|uniref:Uncharacterized protein n=1 Tax=Izhakiella australiensis TaxID=1926881 RepID=A0A1S8YP10_9GAMM|nr:hypothetical protein [Izhakiella australiensis]OON40790.1 hypothetical protein BTJ39_06845 [Izhakiella australiensis]